MPRATGRPQTRPVRDDLPAVAPNTADKVTIPAGYKSGVVIRWGEPVVPGAPAFDPTKQSAAAQAQQFGYNNDYVAVIPLDRHGERALLVVNHEYTNEELMFPGVKSVADTTAEHKKIAMAAHGLSVVELERYGIDVTKAVPDGSRRWDTVDERFDLAKHPHEANRFGWIVELDPYDKNSTPRKRTALGRFKHEGGGPSLTNDGRAVVYMGDDERFDYIYKFVSDRKMRRGDTKHHLTLLDSGTLYVAKLSGDSPAAEIDGTGKLPADQAFDGTGTWIPLVRGDKSLVEGFTVEEVLITGVPPVRPGRTRPTRATATSTGTSWRSPRSTVMRRRSRSPGRCRRVRQGRQPMDLHRRQRARLERRAVRDRGVRARGGARQAVPDRAEGRGDVRRSS